MSQLSSFWVALMEVGFLGYVSSLFLLIFRGIEPTGRVRRRPATLFALLAVLSFALWLYGLRRA
jgi:hypothetical protein